MRKILLISLFFLFGILNAQQKGYGLGTTKHGKVGQSFSLNYESIISNRLSGVIEAGPK